MLLIEKGIGNPYGELWTGIRAIWLYEPRPKFGYYCRIPVWIRRVTNGEIYVEHWKFPGRISKLKREYQALDGKDPVFQTFQLSSW